jgi:hypothetical protein
VERAGKIMTDKTKAVALVAYVLAIGVASMPQNASAAGGCGASPQQTALIRPIPLGVSGGNIHSSIRKKTNHKAIGCFSGTLGAMVQDSQNNEYILSNNHVLADQNQAHAGELILQPGLVDVQCLKAQSDAVATFSRAVDIKFGTGKSAGGKNTVDAAIAAVEPGQVSPEILFIGGIASSIAPPAIALPVQKMGRTTCVTTGMIAALDADVMVNYSDTKKPKLARFVNQILVTGSASTPEFGAPGDSGSLIVTDEDCPQAVALLFAGSSSVTIANPISAVLSGLNVSMVGSCNAAISEPAPADVEAQSVGLSTEIVEAAKAIRDRHEDTLMHVPGAVGTGIAAGDEPGQPAIDVYLEKMTPEAQAAAPKDVEGMPVHLIESGEIFAY